MTKPELRKHTTGTKRAVPLGAELDKTLLAYAAAAAAASVEIFALAVPGEAKIVYTHAHRRLPLNHILPLDLNHDGKTDFTFNDTHGTTYSGGGWGILTFFPNKSANQIWGHVTSQHIRGWASALAAGVQVGSKGRFYPGQKIIARSSSSNGGIRKNTLNSCYGSWKDVTNRYLGLKFMIKGKTHYGWARLNVSCANLVVSGTLTGYAYETVPGKSIVTGKTKGPDVITLQDASLGHLAQGSSGLSAWRNESADVTH